MGKEEDAVRGRIDDGASTIEDAVDTWAQWLRGRRSLAELVRLITDHRLDSILTTQDLRDAATDLAKAINSVYSDTADAIASEISADLSGPNTYAVARMQDNTLRLVRELTDEQWDTIRAALKTAIEQGMNPNESARWLRGCIGLTESQQAIVANYRQALADGSSRALDYDLRDARSDRAVQRAIDDDQPLSSDQIDRMVGRYQDNLVGYRARVIARTESLRAVHQGSEDAWKHAVGSGAVAATEVARTWRTAHDGRVRSSHRAMDKQERKLDEDFVTSDGVSLAYPGDPDAPPEESIQCRCVVVTRIRRARI